MSGKVTCGVRLVAFVIGAVCLWILFPYTRWVGTQLSGETVQSYEYNTDPNGFGPAYPNYWVTEDYWVGETCPVSNEVQAEAEKILAPLDADNISKTAVVCMPAGSVQDPAEYAKRFNRYYGIGNAEGERKDNGITWLILYDEQGKTEVHVGIGDGLPKINPGQIGDTMRATQNSYSPELNQETNLANAIMTLTNQYNFEARESYQPWNPGEVRYGGPITKSEDEADAQFIWIIIICGLWLVFASEPLLAMIVLLFGSYGAWQGMAWPFYVLKAIAEAKSGSPSHTYGHGSPGHSSGKNLGGSRNSTRQR